MNYNCKVGKILLARKMYFVELMVIVIYALYGIIDTGLKSTTIRKEMIDGSGWNNT